MKAEEIIELGYALMKKHGVNNYSFKVVKPMKSYLGKCCPLEKEIWITSDIRENEITETILHEIAHALVFDEMKEYFDTKIAHPILPRPLSDYKSHGKVWKEMCIKVGCVPTRTGTPPMTDRVKKLRKMFRNENKEKEELKKLMDAGLINDPRCQELGYKYKRHLPIFNRKK